MGLLHLSATELFKKLQSGDLSSTELTQACLDQIQKTNPTLQSFLTFTDKEALETATIVDQKIARGEPLRLLEGIPIALKDNLCTQGIRTTCGSRMLENFIPPYSATVVALLKARNMPMLGKTNMDEFAMGSSTETSYFQKTCNPWDKCYVPGGSSGGSAVAVAGYQAPLSIGSDTGGSIRQPASFCGVVGMKPTYGRVSRYGLIAFASSLDQIGPFARTVEDCASLLTVLAGYDPRDSTSQNKPAEDYTQSSNYPLRGVKIGLPIELFQYLSTEIRATYNRVLDQLSDEGVELSWIQLPSLEYALATYYIIAPAEASSNLARYDGVRFGYRSLKADSMLEMMECSRSEGFGAEVKRRILIGTYVLSSGYYDAYYKKAQKVRTLIEEDFSRAFRDVDHILSPTTATPAFRFGEKTRNPLEMYLSDVMTIPANLAGLPAISIPFDLYQGLPMGLQLVGASFSERRLLAVAHQVEHLVGFDKKRNFALLQGDS
ncbi:MAG: Asp-tRNA(Asn)/Glu-tRNA(Gln) amidotransferase subunit GatA [Candidatus Margulisiibacteriota bacterium]